MQFNRGGLMWKAELGTQAAQSSEPLGTYLGQKSSPASVSSAMLLDGETQLAPSLLCSSCTRRLPPSSTAVCCCDWQL